KRGPGRDVLGASPRSAESTPPRGGIFLKFVPRRWNCARPLLGFVVRCGAGAVCPAPPSLFRASRPPAIASLDGYELTSAFRGLRFRGRSGKVVLRSCDR